MRLIGLNDADTVRLIEADRSETAATKLLESDPNTEVRENMAVPRRKLFRCIKIMLAITVLGTIFVVVRVHLLQADGVMNFSLFVPAVYKIDDTVKLKISDNTLSFADSTYGQFLKFKLTGEKLNTAPDLDSCLKILGTADVEHARKLKLGFDPFMKSLCLKWKDTVLVINDTRSRGSRCFSVNWTTSEASSPDNCVSLSGAHWYGGSLLRDQRWPLEEVSIPMQPFISSPLSIFQRQQNVGDYGPVLERMWINSRGFGIIANSDEPLYVSVNAHQKAHLCLKTKRENDSNSNSTTTSNKRLLSLNYMVCMDRTAQRIHEHFMKSFLTLPSEAPSEHLMQDPVWSTRGININNLTQEQALTLQIDISKYNFLHSQLYIAGNVTRTVGGIYFDHERFPNAHQMVGQMKFNGFSVTTSVLPVMERKAPDFEDGAKLSAFVDIGKEAGEWSDKAVALIDFTSPSVRDWMAQRLASFRAESAAAGFHFDSGEATLLSQTRPMSLHLPNPCDYSRHYVQFAHSLGNNSIVSVGYRTQKFPVMLDIGPRFSSWGYELGLKSIIPSVLTLGLLGYPFLVVGPVGGVPVDHFERDRNRFALPDEELYIRWLQLSVFLPGLEISVGPWQYSREVTDIAHRLLKHRADRVLPMLQTAIKEFLRTGAPVIRPLWWMATEDEVAQTIDSQFLVSNTMLVAPVLEAGARRRDVYLPKVKDLKWKDVLRGEVYAGGQWLHGYKVDLSEVATFVPVYKVHTEYHLRH